VQALINEFKGDYNFLSEHLKIMNKRMVLLNPVSSHLIKLSIEIHKSLSFEI